MRESVSVTAELSLPEQANPRYADLNRKESETGRVIGGDQADLHFRGYTVEEDRTVLCSCELTGNIEGMTQDEINDLAATILAESYASIGVECVEHN